MFASKFRLLHATGNVKISHIWTWSRKNPFCGLKTMSFNLVKWATRSERICIYSLFIINIHVHQRKLRLGFPFRDEEDGSPYCLKNDELMSSWCMMYNCRVYHCLCLFTAKQDAKKVCRNHPSHKSSKFSFLVFCIKHFRSVHLSQHSYVFVHLLLVHALCRWQNKWNKALKAHHQVEKMAANCSVSYVGDGKKWALDTIAWLKSWSLRVFAGQIYSWRYQWFLKTKKN